MSVPDLIAALVAALKRKDHGTALRLRALLAAPLALVTLTEVTRGRR